MKKYNSFFVGIFFYFEVCSGRLVIVEFGLFGMKSELKLRNGLI